MTGIRMNIQHFSLIPRRCHNMSTAQNIHLSELDVRLFETTLLNLDKC